MVDVGAAEAVDLSPCPPAAWSYQSIMPTDQDREKIDAWVAVSPDTRVIETTRAGERWESRALENGEVRYEEVDLGGDEPALRLLARWCGRQLELVPRPPVKTSGPSTPGSAQSG